MMVRAAVALCIAVTAIPEASADLSREHIRVALQRGRAEVLIISQAPVRLVASAARRTMSGPLQLRRHGSGVALNGTRFPHGVRIEPTTAPLALDGALLRGAVIVSAHSTGLVVVNDLDLDAYVKGVVPSEVPAAWPLEALKAQAIIARTYALYQKAARAAQAFDVDATVNDQVYGGLAREDVRTAEAVDATSGRVVTHDGRLALTPYHSTSAGPTEDASELWDIRQPYLKGVDCSFDTESPAATWTRVIPVDEIEDALGASSQRVGHIATLTPLGRNRSGRVKAVRILHSEGELILKGEQLRRIIGYQRLPSMRFDVVDVRVDPDSRRYAFFLEGGGWGHGVGLCQWGMKALAERGWSAERILAYYYPGTLVEAIPRITDAS